MTSRRQSLGDDPHMNDNLANPSLVNPAATPLAVDFRDVTKRYAGHLALDGAIRLNEPDGVR